MIENELLKSENKSEMCLEHNGAAQRPLLTLVITSVAY
jgi:hypothetical protein